MKRLVLFIVIIPVFGFIACSSSQHRNFVPNSVSEKISKKYSKNYSKNVVQLTNGVLNALANKSESEFSNYLFSKKEFENFLNDAINAGQEEERYREKRINWYNHRIEVAKRHFSETIKSDLYSRINWETAKVTDIRLSNYFSIFLKNDDSHSIRTFNVEMDKVFAPKKNGPLKIIKFNGLYER